ncbi:MAG: hypothetical protein IJA63_05940 [Akkermansia sp.]|nr:hypothetical protein [Akkermansia sp.]
MDESYIEKIKDMQQRFKHPVIVKLHRLTALVLLNIVRSAKIGELPDPRKIDLNALEIELMTVIDFAEDDDYSKKMEARLDDLAHVLNCALVIVNKAKGEPCVEADS